MERKLKIPNPYGQKASIGFLSCRFSEHFVAASFLQHLSLPLSPSISLQNHFKSSAQLPVGTSMVVGALSYAFIRMKCILYKLQSMRELQA
ncbi:hypothetical protein CEXT_625861 [Caerostris extrusa]|uniref:Uncharacterized protein n=1 Tax=Caerostris extrusa TaxID=172846 RepID=A0AAV4XKE9_CAEEX|nr:hypothetical protein CEXT_625861 [Caerostris extrusa]